MSEILCRQKRIYTGWKRFFFFSEWAAQALPGHRCPEMCQFAVHSALPAGPWWSGHRCRFLGAVTPDQFPKAVPRPWEPAAGIPPPQHSPAVSTAAAAEWEHCSSNACSYTVGPISSSSPGLAQDLGRQEDNGEKLRKHAKREKNIDSRWTKREKTRCGRW